MNEEKKVLEGGHISQEQIEEIVNIALQVLKSLMIDTETPIEIRLRVALEIFELFGTDTNQVTNEEDSGVLQILEKNALDIKNNAQQLSCIETLLTMAAKNKSHEPVLLNEEKVINH